MFDSSPLLISKALQSLPPFLQAFTLELHMFHTILLGHLLTREHRPLLAKHNQLEGNHHPTNLFILEDYLSMQVYPSWGTTPFSCSFWKATSIFQSYPCCKSTTGRGETFICWKPFKILGHIFRRHFYSTPHWEALV
jgi:hypothetical protein